MHVAATQTLLLLPDAAPLTLDPDLAHRDYHVILVQHLEQPSILSNHSPAGRAGSSGSSAAAAGSPAGAPATKTSVTAPACNSHGRGGTASGQAGGGLPPGGALVWDLDSVLSFPCSGQVRSSWVFQMGCDGLLGASLRCHGLGFLQRCD